MPNEVHPRLQARGTKRPRDDGRLRILVCARTAARASWIEHELARADAVMQTGRTIDQIVSALVDDPPPRPQVLVIDVDALDAGELLYLHAIRERGWCGRIIAVGDVPRALRSSLGIECVLEPPLSEGVLREAIDEIGFGNQTLPIPIIDELPGRRVIVG